MKARDLAALAALGVAGYAAYNKFGKKKDEPKKKMGEGLEMSNQGAYERATIPKSEEVVNEKRSRQENDVPEALSRQERDVPERIMGRDAAGSRFTDRDVVSEKFTPRDKEGLIKKKDVSARPSAAGANSKTPAAALKASTTNDDADAAAKSLSSTGGPSIARARAIAADSNAEDAVEVAPKTRAFTPPGAQDSMGAFTNAGQADAAASRTRAFTPPGYVASANDYNRASTTNTPSNAALGDYARAINPAMHADRMLGASHPSSQITDKLAVGSRANQAAALAKKQAEQARLDALRIGRRAKGGMVKKMASGGMTSSKPSTASSRGDGIAQRGKTRGMIR
jgi:hypothetical protein